MQESVLLRKTECLCGTSSDAFAIYSDGHAHCFRCEKSFSPAAVRRAGYSDLSEEGMTENDKPTTTRQGRRGYPLRGSYNALAKRRLTEETTSRWKYLVAEYNSRNVQVATYCDPSGVPVAQKLRLPDKSFIWIGERDKCAPLYGMWLWGDKGKRVIITEGEIDAMTVSQLQGHKWPVVSVPDGAPSAHKYIKKALDWLIGFDEVVLMFDNDEPGQKAVEKCVTLLPPGKAKVATLPLKDASDMLQANRGEEVVRAVWNAREWRPDSIQNANELWDEFIRDDADFSTDWPWSGLNKKLLGLRKRELVVLTAGSGIGKSSVCRETAHWLLKLGFKVGYIALEESNRKTLQELVSLELNRRLIKVPKEGEGAIPQEELRDAFDRITGTGNLYLYNHFGSLQSERLLNHMRYLVVSLGVDFLIFDHLSILVSGDDSIGDERRAIDVTMTKLRSFVEETGVGMILVSHLKRPEGKGHEEGAQTSLAQLRGSAAIAQLADAVIGLERNQQDPANANRTSLRVLKNRYTGETGPACGLLYDDETGRLSEESVFDDEDDEGYDGTPSDY